MNLLKTTCVLGMVTALAALSPLGAMAKGKKYRLKFAETVFPAPSAQMDAVKEIVATVKEKSGGRITFKVYGPELADWTEVNEMVNRGDIDMMLSPMSPSYDKRWNAAQMPYIITSYADAPAAFGKDGFMTKMYKEWAADVNMVWLGTWFQGFTGVSLSERGATTPEEAKGIKIRTTTIPVFQCTWEELGFSPTLIPYSEVPTAISTGVVDGQSGGGPFQTYSCCRDLNKYFVFYRDSAEVWGFTFNLDKWNKLDKEAQQIIQDAVSVAADKRMLTAKDEDLGYMKKLEEEGLTVIDLADFPEKLEKSKENARKCWVKLDKDIGKKWMDIVRENAQ